MGNGHVVRYIGGKRPQKYFLEDIWPNYSKTLKKLNIDETRGLEIFKIFCKIDVDESRTLEIEECMNYFGGKRTKFTERIFDVLEDVKGLDFINFTYVVWNYCTLNAAGIARYIFEIFDPDNNLCLEKPDVEAIYRMLYDTNDHDTKHIAKIKFDDSGKISKEKFIKHMRSKKFVIRPAIDYQKRMRRQLGGLIMWEGLTGYRKRHFSVYDSKSTTLEDSFLAIVASPDVEEPATALDSAQQLEQERVKISTAVDDAKQRMTEFKKFREEEKRKQQQNIEDRAVSLAWMAFEAKKYEFENTTFTIDDIWKRQEERNKLFEVFDQAVTVQNDYWIEKGRREEITAFGSDSDKEAKVRDALATEEGKLDYERIKWMVILEATMKRMSVESSSEKVRGDIATIQQQYEKLSQGLHNFHAIKKLSDRFTKKYDLIGSDDRARVEFANFVVDSAIQEMRDKRKNGIEERAKEIKRREFEVITKYGARNTRWEVVDDPVNKRKITINVDTMRVLGNKACICEFCDAIIEENDFRCFNCQALRSVKNAPLYRPLGAL